MPLADFTDRYGLHPLGFGGATLVAKEVSLIIFSRLMEPGGLEPGHAHLH